MGIQEVVREFFETHVPDGDTDLDILARTWVHATFGVQTKLDDDSGVWIAPVLRTFDLDANEFDTFFLDTLGEEAFDGFHEYLLKKGYKPTPKDEECCRE
jgi:hypothetical protein